MGEPQDARAAAWRGAGPTMDRADVILTPDQRVRVFISSTLGELAEEWAAARRAIERLHLVPVWYESGARPHPPRRMYRAYLEQSQVFVGIYWQRYGRVAPGMDISGLEDEYRLAAGKPMLLYLKRPAPDTEPRLAAMIDGIRAAGTVSYRTFATPLELERLLADDLAVLLSESFAGARAGAAALPAGPGQGAGVDLPAGAVTFVFTDIEGSTRLVKALRDRYAEVLAGHRRLVRAAIAAQGGHEVDTQGDAFFAAFGSARQAVLCALEIQRALAGQDWPGGARVRVRIGVHTGQAVPAGGAYTGLAVRRAARICAAAAGGQVLVSQPTRDLIEDEEEAEGLGFALVDAGEVRLKDLDRPVRLFELAAAGLDPGPRLGAGRHNLPSQLSPLIGRGGELAAIGACLDANRLVTLTGAGGVGKTRLAVAAASERAGREAIRCWWVELAPLRNPDAVASAVASALGVREMVSEAAVDAIARFVGDRPVLVVLDNCEHVVAACAELAGRLLALCAGLTVLATSREPLGVPGEVSWRVPSLPAPAAGQPMTVDVLGGYESVQLFADRAARARPGFALDAGNGGHVAEICTRLDGIPLAIELAAARCEAMAPEQIAGELGHRFRLLTGGARSALPRQQTLAASVSWSYDLLGEEEQALFRRLGVFTGPFPVEAAEAVVGGAADRWAVLAVLSQLVGKSLVVFDTRAGWYRLLETLRLYALDRCEERGELADAREAHAAWWSGWLGRHHPQAPSDADLDAIELAYPNLRAALEWSVRTDPARSLDLAGALGIYWNYTSRLGDAAALGGAALEAGRRADPAAWARAAGAVTYPRYWAGDTDFLSTVTAEAVTIAGQAGDRVTVARCRSVGFLEFTSVGQLRELLALLQAAGDPWFEARILGPLAILEFYTGDPQGHAHLARLGALAEQIGNSSYLGGHRLIAAIELASAGQIRAALEHLEVVLPSLDRLFNPQVCLEVLKDLAWYALLTGDRPRLEQAVRRLIDDPRDWGVLRPLADALPGAMGLAPRTAEPVHLPGLFANVIWAFLDGEPDAGPRRPIPAGGPPQPGHPMEQVGTAILAYLDGDLRGAEQTVVALGLHPAEARPFFLAMLAHCAADAGSHTEAARLLGAADVLRERSGLQWFPRFLAAGRAEAEHATRTALGQQRFSAAYAEGSSLDADHAVAYALRAHGQRSRPPADRPASPRPSCRSPSMSPPAGRTRRSPPPCPSAGRPSNPPVPHLPQTPSDQPRRTRRRSRPPPAPAPAMAEPALIHLTSPASQLADAVRAGTPAADHGSLP